MDRSTVGGSPLNPFTGLNIPWLLGAQACNRPDHPFVIWAPFGDKPAQTFSYRKFRSDVLRLAAGLARRGIKGGDRVIVHLNNCPEILLSWFALGELGAVAVLTNTRAAQGELRYFVENSRPVAAITQPSLAGTVKAACSTLNWIAVTCHDGGEPPASHQQPELGERFELLFEEIPLEPSFVPDSMSALSVQYTSGTTARPKGVVWTHANSLWCARECASHAGLRPDDIHLAWNPLFHTNALGYTMLPTLWAGSTMVLRPRISPRRFWQTAAEYSCTRTNAHGFLLTTLRELGERPAIHSFRVWDGGPATERNEWGIKMPGLYGMTELVAHATHGHPHLRNYPGSCGRPMPGYDVRLERDDGTACERGEVGSLFVGGARGVSLFKEYLNDAEATLNSFDERGLVITGDRLRLNPDGSLSFVGREKDMLKVGGENVAAVEIESVLLGIEGVAEVAVVAMKHGTLGEVPVAFVRAKIGPDTPPEESVRAKMQEACALNLADFKHPREIHFIDDFPRSTVEKISKVELRKRLASRPIS